VYSAAEWRKGRDMDKLRSVVAFTLMCGAGALLAAAGDTLTTPDNGIVADFAFRPSIPFQSLKQVPVWGEIERMLDSPGAIAACPPDGIGHPMSGNAQGYGARCSTVPRRRSYLPAGCTYDPTTGLPPCNDALLPRLLVQPTNYNPVTGEQTRLLDPAFPGVASFASRGPVSSGASRLPNGLRPVLDYNSPIRNDGGDPGEPAGYSQPAVCGNDPVAGFTETRAACAGNTGRLIDPTRLANGQPRGIVTRLRKPTVAGNYLVNSVAALAGRPQALTASNPGDYVRDPAMATVLGKALFWTCSWAAMACRPAVRATSTRAPTIASATRSTPTTSAATRAWKSSATAISTPMKPRPTRTSIATWRRSTGRRIASPTRASPASR